MDFRKGFLFATGLAFAFAGCASGGGGGSAPATTSSPTATAPTSSAAEGERPRDDQYTNAAQDYLDDGFAQETLGRAAEAESAFANAVAQAELAVEADPTNPRAHILLGEAYLAVGRYVDAGMAYDEALELRPAYVEETEGAREQGWVAVYQAAAPLVQAGEYDGALELLRAADMIYEGRPEVKILLGQILAQEGEHDEAVAYLEEAEMFLNSPRMEEVDTATAASWREQGEIIQPTIASALLSSEQYGRAIPVLEGLREEDPGNIDYVLSLATSYREEGRAAEASALYQEVAGTQGLPSRNYESLGIGLYQSEDYLAAADAFERAAQASVNNRDALELAVNSLQLYYVAGGQEVTPPEDAQRWLEMAQRWRDLDPANPTAYSATAQAMTRVDNMSGASELMNAAEVLPFNVRNLQMLRLSTGAAVTGDLSAGGSEGGTAQMRFTFYDAAGNAIGTQDVTMDIPTAEGATNRIDFEFQSPNATIDGYGYEIIG